MADALTLPSAVFGHARAWPTKTALEVWEERSGVTLRVTFGDLAASVAAAVPMLRAQGLDEGQRFAMWASNSVAYVAVSVAGMAFGAISVNLNWRLPEATNEKLVQSLEIELLVHDAPFKAAAKATLKKVPRLKLLGLEAVCATPLSSKLPVAPLPDEAYAAVVESEARLSPERVAAVFFTGGTTGTPKAVPHTHRGLVWQATSFRAQFPAPFAADAHGAGTICFTPFFHVMGFVANLCFNLVAGVRAAILASHDAKLHPRLMLAACKALKPTVVNTVPWVVEGLVEMLVAGEPSDASAILSAPDLVTYGGAALAPHCPDVLRRHGVTVLCTYGQTELAGPVLFGNPGGDPNALLPLRGVRYELVRGEADADNEGELVLLGNGSSTAGYLPNPSDPRKHRSLTGDAKGDERRSTSERYRTNDRFRRELVDGREMLLYICRADDLLVHTSGEMTNPLPSEQRLIAECPNLLHAVAVVGTNQPRCAALLELREGVNPTDAAVLVALRAGLAAANTAQPAYSHVLERHALLLPQGSMPLTVKGTVMRNKVEAERAEELITLFSGGPLSVPTLSAGDEDGAADSLNLAAVDASRRPHDNWKNNMMLLAITFVFWRHDQSKIGRDCQFDLTPQYRAVQDTYGSFAMMPFFMTLAGVSVPETYGVDTVRSLACYLLLSTALTKIWWYLPLWISQEPEPGPDLADLVDEILVSKFWFLVTLFLLRTIWYPLVNRSWWTLGPAMLASAGWWTFADPATGDDIGIYHTRTAYIVVPFALSFYFLLGVALQKLRVLAFCARQLLDRPWLRVLPLLMHVGLIVPCFFAPYQSVVDRLVGNTDHPGDMIPSPWTIPLVLLYFVALAGVTPVSRIPMLTSGGARTLTAYLLNLDGHTQLTHVLQYALLQLTKSNEATIWLGLFVTNTAVVLLCTSELVAVALWPIVTPTWAVGLLTGADTPPPPVVTRWAAVLARLVWGSKDANVPGWWTKWGPWLVWLVPLLAVTFIFYGSVLLEKSWIQVAQKCATGSLGAPAEAAALAEAAAPAVATLVTGGLHTHTWTSKGLWSTGSELEPLHAMGAAPHMASGMSTGISSPEAVASTAVAGTEIHDANYLGPPSLFEVGH